MEKQILGILKDFSIATPCVDDSEIQVIHEDQFETASKEIVALFQSPFERIAIEHLKFSLSTYKEATAYSSIEKLESEILEVKQAIVHGLDDLAEEYADCFLCLIDSAARSNLFTNQILEAMAKKVVKKINRKWVKNENNTYSHVKQ